MRSHWPVTVLSTLSSFVAMLLPLSLVRTLEPAEIGAFKIFFLYLMVLPPLTLTSGVTNGLSYWAGRGEGGLRAIRASAYISFFISALALSVMLAFRSPIAESIQVGVEWVTLFSFALFLAIASSFFDEAAVATGRIWRGALFHSGFELLRVGVIVVTATVTRDLTAIIYAHLGVQSTKVIFGYALSYRFGLLRWEWDPSVIRAVGRYALPVSLAFVFGLSLNYSDQIILSNLLSAPDFALYALGCLTVPPLLILEASLTRVLIPQLSQAFSDGKKPWAARLYRKAVHDLGFLIIPSVIGMAVFAEPIIELLFTKTYLPGAKYLQVFAFWYLALVIPPDAVARAQGAARWILGNFVAFSALTVTLCGLLAIRYGPMGALSGLLAARTLSRIYTLVYMRREFSLLFVDFIPLRALAKMGTVAVGLGVLALAVRPLFSSSFVWFFVCGFGFGVAYLGLTLVRSGNPQTDPRKVLMLTPGLFVGGLERMILNLSKSLKQDSQWQPQILAYDFGGASSAGSTLLASFAALGIPVRSSVKPPRFSFHTVLRVARHASEEGVTVIHTHDLGALIYGVLAKILLRRRIRVVHTQHSFVHLERSWKYRYYERFFTWFVDSLVVVSEDTRRGYLDLGVRKEKVHLIANGVEFPKGPETDAVGREGRRSALLRGHPEADLPTVRRAEFWILYLARIHGRKGQDHALRLWEKISPSLRSRSALIFVGPETDPLERARLQRMLDGTPDASRIVFAGASQVPLDWIRASDVFLSCSEFEGMPLSPIEAIGSGVPAVLSSIPGHAFLGAAAELYSLESPEEGARALERVLERLITGKALFREECWERSEKIREVYTLAAMSREYTRLYERCS